MSEEGCGRAGGGSFALGATGGGNGGGSAVGPVCGGGETRAASAIRGALLAGAALVTTRGGLTEAAGGDAVVGPVGAVDAVDGRVASTALGVAIGSDDPDEAVDRTPWPGLVDGLSSSM